ncbi:MAG: CopG family transcriptional regulator [Dehalococcoidia bacterium]
MARLTITLSDAHHQQLRMRATREGKSIGQVIEETLTEVDEANRLRAMTLSQRARSTASETMAGMADEEIEQWVVDETVVAPRKRMEKMDS